MTLPTAMPVFPLRAATTEAAGPGNDVPASLHKGPQMFLQGIGCGKSQALSQPVSGLFHRIVADVLNPRYLPAGHAGRYVRGQRHLRFGDAGTRLAQTFAEVGVDLVGNQQTVVALAFRHPAQTPFYKAFLAHLNKLGKVNNKAMARFLVYIGGQWMASLSTSAFNSECRADSYELYVPADYSGPFDIWGSLSGNCYGNNACISSLFYRLDGNELKTVGVRTLMQPHYSDANGVMHSWGYPRFVRPTACGMYIEKKGGKSKKIIIK